ncbi:sensor histidine kinase [Bacillus sp. M6-12]|uniref:sensor histidine kinase n=1 Tax=Bacillus sp. M6-12 TaxID=2054166 RepID=UPI000C792568|nr:sensor histidine kinase [Bacillus sp. M6-12]PLS18423.1 sensor histidine kinase [Bacillus sp. M6-12]
MSIIQRQIIAGLCFSLLLSLLIAAVTIIVFPIGNWSELWKREVMDFPYLLFVPGVSIIAGTGFGVCSGLFWRKQIQQIGDALYQLEQGQAPLYKKENSIQDFSLIETRLDQVQRHVSEQIKATQKLANENAEELEKRMQEIVSQERNRLARELHDSVSQQLFAASMLLSAINEAGPEADNSKAKQLRMVEEMIHQSQLEMRALLLHLRPIPLRGKSLQEGIQELLAELQQKVPMDISWKVEPVPLDKGIEDHLFRILQESVSNTLRHAKASALEVLLISRDDLIILRIADDGEGFNMEESKAGSYGLQNMHERAVEIGGTMKIVSVKNKGTRLEVKVPLMAGGMGEND